jgi:hypothetical protein
MSFGKLGAMGRGMGHLGALGGASNWRSLFRGTGRVGLMLDGVNATSFGSFGDNAGSTKMGRRVGAPWYVALKETATNVWLGYDIPSTAEGSAGIPHACSYSVYKPMTLLRWDHASASDGSGGAVDYPQTSTTQWIEWNVSSVSTAVTRLAAVIGFTGDNCGIATVTIKDGSNNDITASLASYLLIATAAQAVARGQCASGVLTTNGGTIDPASGFLRHRNIDDGYRPLQRNPSP